MRFDVVTIFPDYLRALDLSLVGRAAAAGTLEVHVHDLRRWAHDRHRTVDGTPAGGGAGMVMRPDVWGEALDEVMGLDGTGSSTDGAGPAPGRRVLVVPTPSGELFTQRTAEDLASAATLTFACGRYEGIDARVVEHYRGRGVEVRELSIGDYVLSGGEVAALVVIEAVARLLPGVLGNPESVVEESHGADGLLEHPAYTRPVSWRGLEVDPVLVSGDHARVRRLRRDQSIARTAQRRPDLVAVLGASALDGADRAALATHGWAVPQGADHPVRARVRHVCHEDVGAVADLAARTFPDACPREITSDQVAAHIATNLTRSHFASWVEDPRAELVLAELVDQPEERHRVVGYALLVEEQADRDGSVPAGLDPRPECVTVGEDRSVAELSKIYVDSSVRGSGLARALLDQVLHCAAQRGVDLVWLGTSTSNRRAQRAYRHAGFARVGTRTYDVGGRLCRDVVMVREARGRTGSGPQPGTGPGVTSAGTGARS
ncbi:tRNA (guanosine(37)-N1)-methyltransferase TrmD [Actinomyces wuliandei]|uniref:tRNA (guanosine(37)-N1)-methyltransferase TrmD n=1 Tax=Actinomyces wuliandei TaxID=2057743 RepID=UPI000FD7D236|nr:tRNA (guanosine(37)-N1)-methyltransferase TrmD [Actinomyces wuliandei]